MERPIRIVLTNDPPRCPHRRAQHLTENDGFEVVGDATDGDEAITQTLDLQPDVLLLDVSMPRLPGLEAMRAIMTGPSTAKILLLTSTITTQQIIEALSALAASSSKMPSPTTCKPPSAPSMPATTGSAANASSILSPLFTNSCRRPPCPSARPTALPRANLRWWAASWRLQQPRHCQAIHAQRRNRQAPSLQHLRQNRRLHAPRTGSLRHRAPPHHAAVVGLTAARYSVASI